LKKKKKWQDEKLNPNISELILTAREKKIDTIKKMILNL